MADQPGSPTGTAAAVYGVSVNGSLPALEAQVEGALATPGQGEIRGRDETSSNATGSGASTIRSDGALTSQAVLEFVAALVPKADVSITTNPGDTHAVNNLGSSCASDITNAGCWGTTLHPKIVYVGSPSDVGAGRISLQITGDSAGAGILIIENGSVEIGGNFRWSGLVITTGNNVGVRYVGGGSKQISGPRSSTSCTPGRP